MHMLWVLVIRGVDVAQMVSAMVRCPLYEDAANMVASVWCSVWSLSACRVPRMDAHPVLGVSCVLPDASLQMMILVSLGRGMCAAVAGWYMWIGLPCGVHVQRCECCRIGVAHTLIPSCDDGVALGCEV